jgi:serine/threonine protein kinase
MHRYPQLNDYGIKIRQLGKGTYGTIYLYQQLYSDSSPKTVAIKKSAIYDHRYLINKIMEIYIMICCRNHPNIVQIIDIISKGTFINIVMEAGIGSLEKFLHDPQLQNTFNIKKHYPFLQDIQYQCLLGVKHLHSLNIHHLDISPNNYIVFLVDNSESNNPSSNKRVLVKLTDFATCYINDPAITKYPYQRGDIRYRSLELLIGNNMDTNSTFSRIIHGTGGSDRNGIHDIRVPVDIWALGKVLFEIIKAKPDNITYYNSLQYNSEYSIVEDTLKCFGIPNSNSFQNLYLNSQNDNSYKLLFNSNNTTKTIIDQKVHIRNYFESQLRNLYIFEYRSNDPNNSIEYYNIKCNQMIDLLCKMFNYEPNCRPGIQQIIDDPVFIEQHSNNSNGITSSNNEDSTNNKNKELTIAHEKLRYRIVCRISQWCIEHNLPYYVKYAIITLIDHHIIDKLESEPVVNNKIRYDINVCITLACLYYNITDKNETVLSYIDNHVEQSIQQHIQFCQEINWQIHIESVFDRLNKRFIHDIQSSNHDNSLLIDSFGSHLDRLLSILIFNQTLIRDHLDSIYHYLILNNISGQQIILNSDQMDGSILNMISDYFENNRYGIEADLLVPVIL